MEQHLATCWYCLQARKQMLHVPIFHSKYIWLECCYCQMRRIWKRVSYLNYPCGWWEVHPEICMCTCLDMLGWKLKDGDPILFVPKNWNFAVDNAALVRVRAIQIDHIYGRGRVVACTAKIRNVAHGPNFHAYLCVSEFITVRSFRHMPILAQYFLQHTRQKLRDLRLNSLILKSLHFIEIKRLVHVNASIKSVLLSRIPILQVSDATLAKCLLMNANIFSTAQSNRQWQQFTDLTIHSTWCWRMANDYWTRILCQHIDPGPRGIWQPYRDPTSNRCFWWKIASDVIERLSHIAVWTFGDGACALHALFGIPHSLQLDATNKEQRVFDKLPDELHPCRSEHD